MNITLTQQQAQVIVELMNQGVKSMGLSISPDAYRMAVEVVQLLTSPPAQPAQEQQ